MTKCSFILADKQYRQVRALSRGQGPDRENELNPALMGDRFFFRPQESTGGTQDLDWGRGIPDPNFRGSRQSLFLHRYPHRPGVVSAVQQHLTQVMGEGDPSP